MSIIESSLEAGYQILHYSGHGIPPEDGGGLLLEDSQGNKRPTKVAELLQTLQKAEKDLRLIVISGCQTAKTLDIAGFRDMARGLLKRKVPAIIAMQFSISDAGGLLFAENLYPRLIEGQMLDIAVSACRRALLHTEDVRIQTDAFAPVLLLSNSQPLQTKMAEQTKTIDQPRIDFSFYLPLPQLSFGFYGRRREYRAIRDGLLHKNHRAMIVHGIGGIGKTALISHAATRLCEHFKGVYAFDCSSAALAPETILLELHRYLERQGINALGKLMHQSIPPDQLASFIAQVLSQLSLLIVFDNFETHLVKKDGERHRIADDNLSVFIKTLIKTTAKGSHFLFTSRYLLDLDTKRVGTIAELPLGDLSRPEALGLMQKLPNLSKTSYEEKNRTFDAFGGHPYALVTLDRHCGHRPLADVLHDAKDVHAELREFLAIDLSYNKLSDRSRELLNRLAAFRKPVPTDAAEWVLGEKVELTMDIIKNLDRKGMPGEMKCMSDKELLRTFQKHLPEQRQAKDIEKPIGELIGWGLLTPIEEDSQVRTLAVHSLVRDFCRDKQKGETWNRNLLNAASYCTNQTKLLLQDDRSPVAVWTDMEAFELLMEAGAYENAAGVLETSHTLLDRWGLGRYLEFQYNRIVPNLQGQAEAVARGNLANILQARGEYETAIDEHKKVENIFRKLGDLKNVSVSLHQIGTIHHDRGDFDHALMYYEESIKIKELLGDGAGVSKSLHQIGMIHHDRGDYEQALVHYEKSLKINEELGDRAGIAISHGQIGNIYFDQCDYPQALAEYERVLKIFEELGDRAGIASSHGQMGKLFIETKRYPEAFEHLLMALSIFGQIGTPDAFIAANHLKELRVAWGSDNFDKAWRQKTGEDVPDFLKETVKRKTKIKKKKITVPKNPKTRTKKKTSKSVKAKKTDAPNKTTKTKKRKKKRP